MGLQVNTEIVITTEIVKSVVDIVQGECRNIEVKVEPIVIDNILSIRLVEGLYNESKLIQFCPGKNITWGGNYTVPTGREVFEREGYDGTLTFYGKSLAMTLGAVANCSGNPNKPDYRRLAETGSLKWCNNWVCYEQFKRANEENFSLLLKGEPLITFNREYFYDQK